MPLGLDTPSTIGMALAVLGPVFLAMRTDLAGSGVSAEAATQQAALGAWGVGMAVMLVMGAVKLVLSFGGDWVRRHVPAAGLLGSIGGIGLALLAFLPLLDVFQAPIVGMIVLGIVLYALVARIELPGRIPGAAAAVVAGVVLYYLLGPLGLLGGLEYHAPELSLRVSVPIPTVAGFRALGDAVPYLAIAIPFGLLTVVGGINVTESARAAGDAYGTREILLTEAVATLIAGLFGGVAQSTPYIGHPAYKAMGARAGYTFVTGVVVGLGGILGYVSFMTDALPLVAVVPLLIFIGLEITVQAFDAPPRRHAAAVAFSFLPILAYLLLIRQDALMGGLSSAIAAAAPQLGASAALVTDLLNDVATRNRNDLVLGLGHGFILTAMLWGSFFALVIDRAFVRAAAFTAIAGLLTLFGVIHSAAPSGALYLPWDAPSPIALHWASGYLCMALLILVFSVTGRRGRIPPEPFP